MKNTTFIVALVAALFMSPSFANTTAGGEEQWQIVEEDQAAAPSTASTSKQSAPKQTASTKKSSSNSSSRSGGGSGIKLGMGLDQGLSIVGQINNTINFAVGNDGIAADYIFNRGSFGGDVPFNWYAASVVKSNALISSVHVSHLALNFLSQVTGMAMHS
ncbi:hypothetical protein JCM19240_4333 [Vibrio maritimus]|uniref:Uncharacterized protein n=1 Tax=Vibrio maritimus TaxID=990268 RepID=A0A090T6B9_9VIBR|nr:hypothetical protein JCM19240_4333 [Vibrio maritimus]